MRKSIKLILGIFLLLALYSTIFLSLMHYEGQFENVNPLTAFYWVVVTVTTLGYGDIVFHSQVGRFFSIFVALSGVAILWAVIMPLIITPRLEQMIRAVPSSAPVKMAGHIIISGYNPIVETLAERFSLLKIPFLIIERSEEVARGIYQEYPVILGDPSERKVLSRASIDSARLFIANENEELNAEVILTLRESTDIEIIALVGDLTRSRYLNYAGASRIISPKTLLGTFIAQITSPPRKSVFPGAIQLFGDLKLVELPIYPGARLIGKKLQEKEVEETGAGIVGIWQRGVFVPDPGPEVVLRSNSVLMAVGNIEHLSQIRYLTFGARKEGHTIILGYGDVGRRVARVLGDCGISPLIVDKRDLEVFPFEHITGDATLEVNLIGAGIRKAVGVLILLNQDSDAVYATLLAKNLNPDAFVVVRANRLKSAEKIYLAGADYVASVPIVASHMLAKIIQDEEEALNLLYNDLELKIFNVGKRSHLAGWTLGELNLPGRFGCRVVALERMAETVAVPDSKTLIKGGDTLALIGSPKGIEAFSNAYDRRTNLKKILKIPRMTFR
ncbi:Calcium-gated potassium channel MthK [uncultured archaeon]|nr:Calcium-gated potassium channel MthK [uncultured archaeon]